MSLLKKNNKKANDNISLEELYIGTLGVIKKAEEKDHVDWISLQNNPFIAFTKQEADSKHNFNDYGVDIFSATGYNFFKNYYSAHGYIVGGIYLYNCRPLSTLANDEEIKNGVISKSRILEILNQLNNIKIDKENNSEEILNLIFDIINKLKKTELMIEHKENLFENLKSVATYYITKLIEIKTINYNLDVTSELMIKEIEKEVMGKIEEISKNINTGISIYEKGLTRTLEKK